MSIDGELQTGRQAFERHAWREAFDLLNAADASRGLPPEDLEALAEAAWWTGRLADCIAARERAYAIYVERGDRRGAARVALELSHDYEDKRAEAISQAWHNRAQRLLEEEPEAREHGYLARARMRVAFREDDLERALELARRELDIGMRFGDRNLQALGLHDQGGVLIAMGRVAEGTALIDEATVAAVGGEIDPYPTAAIYCNTIAACRDMADYRRAADWTEAAKRWCERQAIAGFPGMCRVYRAEIMRLRGTWSEAEQEARRACSELMEFNLSYAAAALYEVGEIRFRVGDLPAAEEAFRQAHELGHEPQPGLSLLRLAEGKVDAALTLIRRALADEPRDRRARARLLPAMVEIALAARDLESARAAAEELEAIADTYKTAALMASASCARGTVQLTEGDPAAAARSLRRGLELWRDVDVPYEMARTRLLLCAAYQAAGDAEAAILELETAHSAFERLGAVPDARRAAELLERATAAAAPGAAAVRLTQTFMFTDIVRSTNLVEAIGDDAWADLLRWHDETLRTLFARHGGTEIDHAGDGFFVAFDTPAAAVDCAVAIQRTLVEHRRTQGFSPQVRIGLHAVEATRRGTRYQGKGVHQAARIAALADAGQIVASLDTARAAPSRFPMSEPRTMTLKGIAEPIQVVQIDWR